MCVDVKSEVHLLMHSQRNLEYVYINSYESRGEEGQSIFCPLPKKNQIMGNLLEN